MKQAIILFLILIGFNQIAYAKSLSIETKNYRQNKDSIFYIKGTKETLDEKSIIYGTGFAISDEGHLVTVAHLIKEAQESNTELVVNNDTGIYKLQSIEWIDYKKDIAIIKINAKTKPIKITQEYEPGEHVTLIGNPKMFYMSVTSGILSGIRDFKDYKHVQYTAQTSIGASGSPLLNENGEVIAMVIGMFEGKGIEGLNFGLALSNIPAKYLQLNSSK